MSLSEATVSVPKKKAVFQTGKKKGKLRPGCRYTSGGRTACSPEAAARLGSRSGGSKKASSKKRGTMRINDPNAVDLKLEIGSDGLIRVVREKVAASFSPKEMKVLEPEDDLREARKQFKAAKRCRDRVNAVNDIKALRASGLPITTAEIEKLTFAADAFCKAKRKAADKAADAARDAADASSLLGLSGTRRRKSKARKSGGHPCASPNPPSWCNKKRKSRRKSKR